MENELIVALDFANGKEVADFLKPFGSQKLFLKVGMELFYREGPAIIQTLKALEHRIFLDLKLHDIPNTVKSAMRNLAGLEVDLVNVHAAGGKEMMEAAIEGLEAGTSSGRRRPHCIAVTQLTSTSEEQMNKEQLIPVALKESVLHYAALAKSAGMDGVVCSALEAVSIRKRMGDSFYMVTPGIRMEADQVQDQKRVATPEFARNAGVSAIVVGRSITKAADPFNSYQKWIQAWKGEKE